MCAFATWWNSRDIRICIHWLGGHFVMIATSFWQLGPFYFLQFGQLLWFLIIQMGCPLNVKVSVSVFPAILDVWFMPAVCLMGLSFKWSSGISGRGSDLRDELSICCALGGRRLVGVMWVGSFNPALSQVSVLRVHCILYWELTFNECVFKVDVDPAALQQTLKKWLHFFFQLILCSMCRLFKAFPAWAKRSPVAL